MTDQKPGRGSEQFPLRMPDGMRDALKVAADRNGRSMNAELVARLQASFGEEEKLWDEINRIAETVEAIARTLDRVAPKVESLWDRSEP